MLTAATCAIAVTGPALAAEQQREQAQAQTQSHEQFYGSELMTQQERTEYQARMRTAKSDQELDQLRKAHHVQMQERAKQRGMTLPDEPPVQGKGQGPRYGNPPGAGSASAPGAGAGKSGR
jgi:hypothetical protein